ncbi:MAG: UDP-2,3-diacylglucosamine diphosphatase [Sulfuriferula sp.]
MLHTEPPHSLLVADLHLCDSRPQTSRLFLDFLAHTAIHAESLYILGDLFEYWLGDDTLHLTLNQRIAEALSVLADKGTAIYFMHGNRDFLVAEQFARTCRATLLADPKLVNLHGTSSLLMHGDTLCTDDADYLTFRKQVRDPDWQNQFLAQPLSARAAIARQARSQSESAKQGKTAAIMDVSNEAVATVLRQFRFPRLIHGHTHRPALHTMTIEDHVCERWVLPDWFNGGGFLRCDAQGCKLVSLPATSDYEPAHDHTARDDTAL